MKNKIPLLNYLLNKTYEEKLNMDFKYQTLKNHVYFSKKYSDISKNRIINNELFGIKLSIKYES